MTVEARQCNVGVAASGQTRPQGGIKQFHGGHGQGWYASAMPRNSLILLRYSHDLASSAKSISRNSLLHVELGCMPELLK